MFLGLSRTSHALHTAASLHESGLIDSQKIVRKAGWAYPIPGGLVVGTDIHTDLVPFLQHSLGLVCGLEVHQACSHSLSISLFHPSMQDYASLRYMRLVVLRLHTGQGQVGHLQVPDTEAMPRHVYACRLKSMTGRPGTNCTCAGVVGDLLILLLRIVHQDHITVAGCQLKEVLQPGCVHVRPQRAVSCIQDHLHDSTDKISDLAGMGWEACCLSGPVRLPTRW